MLDKQMLEAMPRGTMFATGIANLFDELPCRWVAVRGDVYDWAIYYHRQEWSMEQVQLEGDKVMIPDHIKTLVPCDDEAFALYRY